MSLLYPTEEKENQEIAMNYGYNIAVATETVNGRSCFSAISCFCIIFLLMTLTLDNK